MRSVPRPWKITVLSVWLCVAAACSRCGSSGPQGPNALLRRLPSRAEAIVALPNLRIVGERIAVVEKLKVANFIAQLQGAGSADEYVNATMQQLGVDLRKPEELEHIGVAPAGGAALVLLPEDQMLSVIAISSADHFELAIGKLAADRLGATVVGHASQSGREVTLFSRPNTRSPELGMTIVDGYALIASGKPIDSLGTFAGLAETESLAKDPELSSALTGMPGSDAWLYLPSSSQRATQLTLQGSVFTAQLSEHALLMRAHVPWRGTQSALSLLEPKTAADRVPMMPDDAFAVARYAADPTELATYLPMVVGDSLARAIEQSGFDVKNELFGNAKPGAVVALSVAPTMKLSQMPSLDVRRTNPFRYLHVSGLVEVKDAGRAEQTIKKVPAFGARVGAQVEPTQVSGQTVYLTHYAQGEGLDFALKGDAFVVGAPEQRLLDALARVGQSASAGGPLDPALRPSLQGPALSVAIDLHRLSEAIKALPSDAWGVGGFAIKATTVRWLDATGDLRAITANASTEGRAIRGELALHLGP